MPADAVGDNRAMSDLPHVDPTRPLSRTLRAYAAVLRTRFGRWASIEVAPRVDPVLLKATGGRLSSGVVLPTALLTTTGAKSGVKRVNPVLYFHDGDDVIVVASSYGREKHPAWFHNLCANPEVVISTTGEGPTRLAEQITDNAELARLWPLADRVYPLYADYRQRTAPLGRTIPMVRIRAA